MKRPRECSSNHYKKIIKLDDDDKNGSEEISIMKRCANRIHRCIVNNIWKYGPYYPDRSDVCKLNTITEDVMKLCQSKEFFGEQYEQANGGINPKYMEELQRSGLLSALKSAIHCLLRFPTGVIPRWSPSMLVLEFSYDRPGLMARYIRNLPQFIKNPNDYRKISSLVVFSELQSDGFMDLLDHLNPSSKVKFMMEYVKATPMITSYIVRGISLANVTENYVELFENVLEKNPYYVFHSVHNVQPGIFLENRRFVDLLRKYPTNLFAYCSFQGVHFKKAAKIILGYTSIKTDDSMGSIRDKLYQLSQLFWYSFPSPKYTRPERMFENLQARHFYYMGLLDTCERRAVWDLTSIKRAFEIMPLSFEITADLTFHTIVESFDWVINRLLRTAQYRDELIYELPKIVKKRNPRVLLDLPNVGAGFSDIYIQTIF
jgi:hypothetical protein